MQHVHGQNQHGRLGAFIESACDDMQGWQGLLASVEHGTARFAKWRWKSLQAAVHDLLRVRAPLEFCFRSAGGFSDARQREGHRLAEVALGTAFWGQTRALEFLIKRLMSFMSWV